MAIWNRQAGPSACDLAGIGGEACRRPRHPDPIASTCRPRTSGIRTSRATTSRATASPSPASARSATPVRDLRPEAGHHLDRTRRRGHDDARQQGRVAQRGGGAQAGDPFLEPVGVEHDLGLDERRAGGDLGRERRAAACSPARPPRRRAAAAEGPRSREPSGRMPAVRDRPGAAPGRRRRGRPPPPRSALGQWIAAERQDGTDADRGGDRARRPRGRAGCGRGRSSAGSARPRPRPQWPRPRARTCAGGRGAGR